MHERRRIIALSAFAVIVISGIVGSVGVLHYALMSPGEDSWSHYEGGGMFITSAPSATGDWKAVVYASACTGHGDIYCKSGGGITRLTNGMEFESSPLFTPDGRCIAFVRERDGRRHIWMMNTDGTKERQITYGNTADDIECFSSDGRHLLFHRSESSLIGHGKSFATYAMRVDGASDPINVGSIAVFAPDGKSVVFTYDQDDLWQIELEKPERRRHRFSGRGWPIGFSGDGRYLVKGRWPLGKSWGVDHEIWLCDLQSGDETQIATGNSVIVGGTDDCRILFFTGEQQDAYVIRVGANAIQVPLPPGPRTAPKLALDGNSAVFGAFRRSGAGDYEIVRISLETLHVTKVATINCLDRKSDREKSTE